MHNRPPHGPHAMLDQKLQKLCYVCDAEEVTVSQMTENIGGSFTYRFATTAYNCGTLPDWQYVLSVPRGFCIEVAKFLAFCSRKRLHSWNS